MDVVSQTVSQSASHYALTLSIFLYCKESHGGHQRAHSVYTGPKGLALGSRENPKDLLLVAP